MRSTDRRRMSRWIIVARACVLSTALFGVVFVNTCCYEKDTDKPPVSKAPVVSAIDPKNLTNGGPTTHFFIDLVNGKQYASGTVLPI